MPLKIRKHQQHIDTFEVGIAWAYIVLRNHLKLLRAFRAFLMLMRYPHSGLIPRQQLVTDYELLGLSADVAYEDIRQLLLWHKVDGIEFRLAEEIQHPRLGKVLKRSSIRWIAEQHKIEDRGRATITREALTDLKKFRAALYEVVMHDNLGDDGYWTVSREGLEKLTRVSPTQQAVFERRYLKITVRQNAAIIADADDWSEAYLPYGPQNRIVWGTEHAHRAIQIRNSYRPAGAFVVRVVRPRRAYECAPLTKDLPTAEEQRQLRPDQGDRCARQTYDGIAVSPGLTGGVAARAADIFLQEGEMTVRDRTVPAGIFMRVPKGKPVTFDDLLWAVKGVQRLLL